jgi:UDP-N-acetylglucosamine diphosphorylase/glucosamine-1-phosphate N-acetyltransferase
MTGLYLYDDARARSFEPFASTRPVSELRSGAMLVRERWAAVVPDRTIGFLAGRRLLDFDETDAARQAQNTLAPGSIVANARCLPALPTDSAMRARRGSTVSLWQCDARVCAVRLRDAIDAREFEDGTLQLDSLAAMTGDVETLTGWWHEEVWDFIRLLPDVLRTDLETMAAAKPIDTNMAVKRPPAHVTIIGEQPVILLGEGAKLATIEPNVILDATNGPIVIDRGAHVHAFTRLVGPCYIGRETTVMGGDISTCSIGPVCKVRGEMSNTILLGYANKGHDGFVGHSYLGRWVNIGASTVTSNLKNTYGSVSLWTPTGIRDTGMQFLGTMFGDHVKTGIGLRLTTGTVLGAGANVYDRMPPKAVAPFSWGDGPPYSLYRLDKFIETAERMMSRRHVPLSDRARRQLAAAHANRWSPDTGTKGASDT